MAVDTRLIQALLQAHRSQAPGPAMLVGQSPAVGTQALDKIAPWDFQSRRRRLDAYSRLPVNPMGKATGPLRPMLKPRAKVFTNLGRDAAMHRTGSDIIDGA